MSQTIMYLGFGIMGASVAIGILSVILFQVSKKKLKKKLEAEFGTPAKYKE